MSIKKSGFSQDWFSNRISQWLIWLGPYIGKPIKGMEIGVFEGKSSIWLLENILTHYDARLFAVDTFIGGDDMLKNGVDCVNIRETFEHNIEPYKYTPDHICSKVRIFEEFSQKALLHMTKGFDFIYIDGSHFAADVFVDVALSWCLLNIGGTIIFDDYAWRMEQEPHKCPYLAIDCFLDCFKGRYERLSSNLLPQSDLQVAVRKICE